MSQITGRANNGPLAIVAGTNFQQTTDANLATLVGTRWDLADGREVILVSTTSATNVTAGYLMQDAVVVAGNSNLTVTAYTTGANLLPTVTVTNGATAVTANQYQGGFVVCNDASGAAIGRTLRIASHPAAANAVALVITLEDASDEAITTSTKVTMVPQHGAGVIVQPTSPTNVCAGLGLYNIAASSYGFLLAKGLGSALSDATVATVGMAIGPSTTTAGTVTKALTTTSGGMIIGQAGYTAVSAKAYQVFLNL
jgi:hypothetical protein